MGLPKGKTNNPNGRPAGSKNVITEQIRTKFREFVEHNLPTIQARFDKLEPKAQLDFILAISEFCVPKLQRIEVNAKQENITKIIEIHATPKHLLNGKEDTDNAK